jgi:hypothetical protein
VLMTSAAFSILLINVGNWSLAKTFALPARRFVQVTESKVLCISAVFMPNSLLAPVWSWRSIILNPVRRIRFLVTGLV